jgi:hypothetical protein
LNETRELPLILSADGTNIVKWWVDGSFATHIDMKGHTGGGITLGRGFSFVTSTKKKLNTRSSTETEIFSVYDCMPIICWTRYSLFEQGFTVEENILFQDNKSAILLEQNGKASSSKRTKHIDIRYFFVTDKISKGELKVHWCPTAEMVADYMTKPLQGKLFRKFRDIIMGVVQHNDAVIQDGETCLAMLPISFYQSKHGHRSMLENRHKMDRRSTAEIRSGEQANLDPSG